MQDNILARASNLQDSLYCSQEGKSHPRALVELHKAFALDQMVNRGDGGSGHEDDDPFTTLIDYVQKSRDQFHVAVSFGAKGDKDGADVATAGGDEQHTDAAPHAHMSQTMHALKRAASEAKQAKKHAAAQRENDKHEAWMRQVSFEVKRKHDRLVIRRWGKAIMHARRVHRKQCHSVDCIATFYQLCKARQKAREQAIRVRLIAASTRKIQDFMRRCLRKWKLVKRHRQARELEAILVSSRVSRREEAAAECTRQLAQLKAELSKVEEVRREWEARHAVATIGARDASEDSAAKILGDSEIAVPPYDPSRQEALEGEIRLSSQAVKLQRIMHRFKITSSFTARLRAAIIIQAHVRRWQSRRRVASLQLMRHFRNRRLDRARWVDFQTLSRLTVGATDELVLWFANTRAEINHAEAKKRSERVKFENSWQQYKKKTTHNLLKTPLKKYWVPQMDPASGETSYLNLNTGVVHQKHPNLRIAENHIKKQEDKAQGMIKSRLSFLDDYVEKLEHGEMHHRRECELRLREEYERHIRAKQGKSSVIALPRFNT